jgi:hypothetical protein
MSWQQVAVDGKNYWHYRQHFDYECGPSCVAMVTRIVKNSMCDVQQTRSVIAKHDTVHQGNFAPSWNLDPSNMFSFGRALAELGVSSARTRGRESAWLTVPAYRRIVFSETKPSKPTILRLDWGHFVVCLGRSSVTPANLVILDPGSDARVEQVAEADFPDYDGGSGHGPLDTDICITTT